MTPLSTIPQDLIDSVRAAHDIVEVVARTVDLKREGSLYRALCPFHEEKSPSFTVTPKRQTFKCFGGCGAAGDVFEWIIRRDGVTFPEAVRMLAAEKGIDPSAATNPGTHRPTNSSSVARISLAELAADKRIPIEFLARLGLHDSQRGVEIPYHDVNGALVYEKGRTALRAKDGSRIPARAKAIPYGAERLDDARDAGYVVVVEGESDCWTLWHHGFHALGIQGASNVKSIEIDHVRGLGCVYVVDEGDSGAAKFVPGIAERLAALDWAGTLRVLRLGVKDPNELHKKDPEGFKAAFRLALDHAPPYDNNGSALDASDLGNARRLVRAHGADLRWTKATGFHLWDGRRWRPDDVGGAERLAKRSANGILDEVKRANGAEAKALARWALRSRSARALSAALELARTEPEIAMRAEDFDVAPYLFNCASGTIDVRTGEQREPRRQDLITRLSSARYTADAEAPTWRSFLEEVLPDPEVRAFFQRAIGSALAGVQSEQVFLVLHGEGANGKTTAMEAIGHVLGDYAHTTPFATLTGRRDGNPSGPTPELVALAGPRLVVATEGEETAQLNIALVKQLTGGEAIAARGMYAKKAFTFLPAFLLVLVSNHRPAIPETTHAAWRRVLLVPFGVRIQENRRDRNLPARLRLEGDGILRWLVDGCREALETGLRPPAAVVAATAAYREAENPLSAFFAERCLLGSPYTCNATTLYAGYRSWAESAGEHPRSQRWFGLRLGELGLTKRTSSTTTWFGIALRPALDSPDWTDPDLASLGKSRVADLGAPVLGTFPVSSTQEKFPESASPRSAWSRREPGQEG